MTAADRRFLCLLDGSESKVALVGIAGGFIGYHLAVLLSTQPQTGDLSLRRGLFAWRWGAILGTIVEPNSHAQFGQPVDIGNMRFAYCYCLNRA